MAQSNFKLGSSSFDNETEIPRNYTCQGQDISPPLKWEGAPAETKSFVLIIDDPDAPDPKAPKMVWDHWIVYNIPASVSSFGEGITQLPEGAMEGLNSWKKTNYGGPCPPIGRHRYFHKIFALDVILEDLNSPTKKQLETSMKNHILSSAVLMGTYQKK